MIGFSWEPRRAAPRYGVNIHGKPLFTPDNAAMRLIYFLGMPASGALTTNPFARRSPQNISPALIQPLPRTRSATGDKTRQTHRKYKIRVAAAAGR